MREQAVGSTSAAIGVRGREDSLSTGTVISAFFVGSIALLILAFAPIVFGALVQSGVLSDSGLGRVATAETLALALSSAVSPKLLRRRGIRWKVGLASFCFAAANVATGFAHSESAVLALRISAGMLEGFMMGATILVMVQSAKPEWLNGLFLAVSAIPQAVGAYVLPTLVIPLAGAAGGFDILAGSGVFCIVASAFIVLPPHVVSAHESIPSRWNTPTLVALVAVFFQNAGIASAWEYVERIADERHFSAQVLAVAMSGNICLQVIGASWGGWVAWRIPFYPVLVIGAGAEAALFATMALSHSQLSYIGTSLAVGLVWLAMSPFQIRLLLELDPSRTAAMWQVAVTLLGLSAGPIIGALAVGPGDVTGALWCAVGLLAMSIFCYAATRAAIFGRAASNVYK